MRDVMSIETNAILDSCETLIECVQSNIEHSNMITQILNLLLLLK